MAWTDAERREYDNRWHAEQAANQISDKLWEEIKRLADERRR